MIFTFITIMLLLGIVMVYSINRLSKPGHNAFYPLFFGVAYLSAITFVVLLMTSLVGATFETTIHTVETKFQKAIAEDKNSIFIKHGDKVYTYSDAETVKRYDTITNITVQTTFNVFGMEMTDKKIILNQ